MGHGACADISTTRDDELCGSLATGALPKVCFHAWNIEKASSAHSFQGGSIRSQALIPAASTGGPTSWGFKLHWQALGMTEVQGALETHKPSPKCSLGFSQMDSQQESHAKFIEIHRQATQQNTSYLRTLIYLTEVIKYL